MNKERDDKQLERLLEEARDYNAPPPTPREAMWARIQEARSTEVVDAARVGSPQRLWKKRVITYAAVAAMILVSFAVGRYFMPASDSSAPMMADETPRAVDERTRDIYRLAAVPVMDRAELLLTQFQQANAVNGERDGYSARASELLVDTRYLMNSPAGDDPELRQLLRDLELVLAQIVRYGAGDGHEKELVDQSMEGRRLLPRLRVTPGTSSDWGYRSYGGYRKVES